MKIKKRKEGVKLKKNIAVEREKKEKRGLDKRKRVGERKIRGGNQILRLRQCTGKSRSAPKGPRQRRKVVRDSSISR